MGQRSRSEPSSQHPDLRGIAPGTHHAFEADGADAHPDDGAGGEAAHLGLAALEHALGVPVSFVVRVAGGGLHLVDALLAVRLVAGDDGAAEATLAQAQVGGGRRWGGVRRARGLVGGEAALLHDQRVAFGDAVDVAAQHAQRFLQRVACIAEREDVRLGTAGAVAQGGVEGGDQGGQRGHRHRGGGERSRVGGHLVMDGVGVRAQFRAGVAAEVDDGFGVVHGFAGWWCHGAVPGG